jgi:hypothetical protein
MYALFDKNHKFFGYADSDFPDDPKLEIFKLEIPEECSNLLEWEWVGDMHTGKMIPMRKYP